MRLRLRRDGMAVELCGEWVTATELFAYAVDLIEMTAGLPLRGAIELHASPDVDASVVDPDLMELIERITGLCVRSAPGDRQLGSGFAATAESSANADAFVRSAAVVQARKPNSSVDLRAPQANRTLRRRRFEARNPAASNSTPVVLPFTQSLSVFSPWDAGRERSSVARSGDWIQRRIVVSDTGGGHARAGELLLRLNANERFVGADRHRLFRPVMLRRTAFGDEALVVLSEIRGDHVGTDDLGRQLGINVTVIESKDANVVVVRLPGVVRAGDQVILYSGVVRGRVVMSDRIGKPVQEVEPPPVVKRTPTRRIASSTPGRPGDEEPSRWRLDQAHAGWQGVGVAQTERPHRSQASYPANYAAVLSHRHRRR
ncbi:MAG: hypothetical protein AAF989_02665 [Planctomycetota bacterium]